MDPRVSRSLQLYPYNCIQQVLEKLVVAALLRRPNAVKEILEFIKIFTAFGTCSYPEPDTPNPLLVPVQSQIHPVHYWSPSRAIDIQSATGPSPKPEKISLLLVPVQSQIHPVHYWSPSRAINIQSATGPSPKPEKNSLLLVPIQSQIHPVRYWFLTSAKCIQAATGPSPEPYISSPPYKTLAMLK